MKEILIKKYENRRLYCVEEAKYVSLNEIKDFLQRGDKVKVIEKNTGKDITKYIMMQVLLEDRYELLPTYFYQMILQSPRNQVDSFFRQFFPWMMDAYKKYQENGFAPPPMGFSSNWMQNPFQMANPFFPNASKSKKKSTKKQTEAEPQEHESDEKMGEILKRLQELEKKLK